MWISSARPVSSAGRSSTAACTNMAFGKPPLAGFLVAFIDGFASGFAFASIPMKYLFGFARAADDTKRPSPVPMSITTPSPVGSDDRLELFSCELSNGAATDLFDHVGII